MRSTTDIIVIRYVFTIHRYPKIGGPFLEHWFFQSICLALFENPLDSAPPPFRDVSQSKYAAENWVPASRCTGHDTVDSQSAEQFTRRDQSLFIQPYRIRPQRLCCPNSWDQYSIGSCLFCGFKSKRRFVHHHHFSMGRKHQLPPAARIYLSSPPGKIGKNEN